MPENFQKLKNGKKLAIFFEGYGIQPESYDKGLLKMESIV